MRHAMIKLSTGFGTRTIFRENSKYSCIIGTSVDCLDNTVGALTNGIMICGELD